MIYHLYGCYLMLIEFSLTLQSSQKELEVIFALNMYNFNISC